MGNKAKESIGGILFGALIIGLLTPHVIGWLGYGFILLCHKMRDLSSHRDKPSPSSTFLAGTQPKNFELTMLGASLVATICIFVGMLQDEKKKNEIKTSETAVEEEDTNRVAPVADMDVESQIVERSKPPSYAVSAPQVTPDGDDMVINFSGWRVLIKKN